MNILEGTQYIISLPTDSEDLASILDDYASDWVEALEFLNNYATSQGIVINKREVAEIMARKYYE